MSVILLNHYEEGNRQIAVHGQFVGRILNFNEEQRKNSDDNWRKADEDIKPVGRIPRCVAMLWQQMGILDDAEELMKALERNPEYKRTEKHISNSRITSQFHDLAAGNGRK